MRPLGVDRNICAGANTLLDPGLFASYLWSNGSTNATININSTGIYWVRVTGTNGCVATDSLKIAQLLRVPQQLLPSSPFTLCTGDATTLTVNGYQSIIWSTGDSATTITVRDAGWYSVKVTTAEGCVGLDSLLVVPLINCIPFTIPSAFSPNNDGLNDVFRPIIQQEITGYQFAVFNRWGQQIFVSTQRNIGWDGTINNQPAENGTYLYWVKYTKNNNVVQLYKGSVTLIR